ncbi:ABC transporter ATP-binding protein [Subdoligranulum variabile]|uniref:ABC transporter, ATP-binding protein n=1 Tax=Subdoligranulum variabile DSM 15176 TaxID=411471 RepID=D1PMB3_9FIRM|nr:ABC transporter ATP-binding protein [Subdoligranulum variabile]EFB75698.1 ABC transporter, ATP-binding protein [Subdoligranulum variabile DSM 15176]UWP68399.1 ABC transporter ATP-binding protein [Subdoligranulum variabile]
MFELRHASVGYEGTPVLRDISFTAQDGQITALVGTNGCGKTTLLKAIARQLPLLNGEILLQGQPIQSFDRKAFARAAAFMPQVRNIPEISVRGLVSHGRFPYLGLSRQMTTRDRAAVEQAMRATGVAQWAERDLRELSGGERQRVYLAMALAQGGDAILLDEPTTYLDVSAQFELLELLRTLADQGKTLLLVLHDLAQALQYSDRVAVVAEGRLLAFDSPANLFEQKILDRVFGVTLCRAPEGTYYLRR